MKLGVVARLKNQVETAKSNKEMAAMVAEFSKVTNRSTGRTITKVCWSTKLRANTDGHKGRIWLLGRTGEEAGGVAMRLG